MTVSAATTKYYPKTVDFSNTDLWGLKPIYSLDDNGEYNANTYWYFRDETAETNGVNESVIRAYDARELPLVAETEGLLAVSTTGGTLFRTFAHLTSAEGPGPSQGVKIPEDGLLVDTYVFLSASEAAPDAAEVAAFGDKIQCALVTDGANPALLPRLVLVASRVRKDGTIEPVVFQTETRAAPNEWHRFTARIVANASTDPEVAYSAFTVYWDGNPVACSEAEYAEKIGAGASAVFAGNRAYETFALFPSLQKTTSSPRLFGVGASGETLLDEITLTDENPFDVEADTLEVVVVCDDAALSALSYVQTPAEPGAAVVTVNLTKPFSGQLITVQPGDTLEFKPTAASHVTLASDLTLSGNSKAVSSASGYKIVFADDGLFASSERILATFSSVVESMRVGDKSFSTFRDAVFHASTNGVTNVILLQEDVNLASAAATDNGQARVYPGQDVVIDLAGRRLKGDHFNSEAAIYAQGTLEIIDSVGGGAIEAVGTAIEVVSTNDALDVNHEFARVCLGRETVTNLFLVNGRVRVSNEDAELVVKVGDFLTPADTSAATFYLTDYLSARSTATPHVVAGTGTYYRVLFDGRYKVDFDVAHAAAEVPSVWVESGETVDVPLPEVPGYVITNWLDVASGLFWTSGVSTVESDLTLRALERTADPYTITYDIAVPSVAAYPTAYTVETAYTKLGSPTRDLFTFAGWRDRTSGRYVKAVGAGATFVDTSVAVYGDLDLEAVFVPNELVWGNTARSLAESNGTYRGSWTLQIPATITDAGVTKTVSGQKIKIREIDFCLVNPHLYPKTAPELAVKTGDEIVLSSVRETHYNETTREYEVGTNVLANGRAKIGYRFANLVLEAGDEPSEIYFTNTTLEASCNGFLRLGLDGADGVIGPCQIGGGDTDPTSDAYLKFAPLYEMRGEAVEE